MPSETVRCAIVGSGLAALATYATLRRGGVRPEEIAVYGTHEDPTEVWRARAAAIRQQRMRSESDGHVAAAAFPGLAVREAARALTVAPLVASVANRYHPRVEDFLRARRVGACGERLGTELPPRADRPHHTGRRRVRRRRRDVPPCARRDRSPRPRAASRVRRRGARIRAARLRAEGGGCRRRHGRRDGMAERARRRQRGRLDPPPRAAPARTQRPARVLLEARARSVPHCERRAPLGDAARALDAVLSARRRVGRAGRRRRGGQTASPSWNGLPTTRR